MAWTNANPVSVGDATKKSHYDAVFDNSKFLRDSVGDFTSLPFGTGVNGSQSAPALTWRDDTDSGIWRIGANNIGVGVGNTKILDISTTGLGVGGAASSKLHVTDSVSQIKAGHNLSSGSGGPSVVLYTANNVYGDILWDVFGSTTRLRASSYGLAVGGTAYKVNIGYADASYSPILCVNGLTAINKNTDDGSGALLQVAGAGGFSLTANDAVAVPVVARNLGTLGSSWRIRYGFENSVGTLIGGLSCYYNAANQFGLVFQTYNSGFIGQLRLTHDGKLLGSGLTADDGTTADFQVSGGISIGASDLTGIATRFGVTGVVNTSTSSGVGTIAMCGVTNRTSSGFWKVWQGTTARWIPFFTTITG